MVRDEDGPPPAFQGSNTAGMDDVNLWFDLLRMWHRLNRGRPVQHFKSQEAESTSGRTPGESVDVADRLGGRPRQQQNAFDHEECVDHGAVLDSGLLSECIFHSQANLRGRSQDSGRPDFSAGWHRTSDLGDPRNLEVPRIRQDLFPDDRRSHCSRTRVARSHSGTLS